MEADISLAYIHWNAIYYHVMQDIHSHHVLRARGSYEDGVNTSSAVGITEKLLDPNCWILDLHR